MAISLQVYPELSPRIVEVRQPTTDVTVQEFYNACREWEDEPANMSYTSLISGAGKEDLGGGVTVGITSTLQNAQIRFEGRTTPLDNGAGRTCDANDPSGKILYVDDADFVADQIYVGCTAFNTNTASMETVTEVIDLHTLRMFPLSGGAPGGWSIGDGYIIYPNVQCSIDGGNLVAVSSNGASISTVMPSPNIQVVRSSSSSATNVEQEALQYSSFGGGVTIDVVFGEAGTVYPIGNQEFPVNNILDAVTIANSKGFDTLFIKESMLLDLGTTVSGFTIIGKSKVLTTITLGANLVCDGLTIVNCNIIGTLDGGTNIVNCSIGTVNFFNGTVNNSTLGGTITLNGGANASFYDCSISEATSIPVIDMGGAGQNCILMNWSGAIRFINMTDAASKINFQMDGGRVVLDSASITAGTVAAQGLGQLVDENGDEIFTGTWNGVTILNFLITKENIAIAVWDEPIADHLIVDTTGHQMYYEAYENVVHINAVTGTSGTVFPIGTKESPCKDLANALSIATTHNFSTLHFEGDYTITSAEGDIDGFTLSADRSLGNEIVITSMTNGGTCYFQDVTISGNLSGQTTFTDCQVGVVNGVNGNFDGCVITGELTPAAVAQVIIRDTAGGGAYGAIINTSAGVLVGATGLSGTWELRSSVNGPPPSISQMEFNSGRIELDATCAGGIVILSGIVVVTDNSLSACVVTIDGVVNTAAISETVWNKPVETNITTGEAIKVLLATLAGEATGGGTSSIEFKNPDGDTTRVTMTVDSTGNRSAVTLNT